MIISMICLLSNSTYAQIYQYSEDGKNTFLESKSEYLGSGLERECYCFAPIQLPIFSSIFIGVSNGSIPVSGGAAEWLRGQELLLASQMDGTQQNYFRMDQLGTLPGTYNFERIQKNYFKAAETNALAAEYYPKVEEYFKNTYNYNEATLNTATFKHKILDIRKREGTNNTTYGRLIYNGKYLANYSNEEIDILLFKELNIRKTQRANFLRYDKSRSRAERSFKEGWMSNYLTSQYIGHYQNLGYEDAVRFMTRYMVWARNRVEYPNYLIKPFGNPHNIFVLEDQDYTSRIAVNVDLGSTMEGWTPRVFTEPNADNVLFNLALSNFDDWDIPVGSFLRESKNKEVKEATRRYMETHRYSRNALNAYKRIIQPFAHTQGHIGADYSPSQTGFFDIGFGNVPNLLFSLQENIDNTTENGLWNMGGVLNALEESEADSLKWMHIAEFTRDFLIANGYPNLSTYFNLHEILRLFEFKDSITNGGTAFRFSAFFTNDIGLRLAENGIRLLPMIDRPYVVEGTRALLNRQPFDFAFREMVYNLSNRLKLNDAQKSTLISYKTEAESINRYLIENNYSPESIEVVNKPINLLTYGEDDQVILFADCASFEFANQTDGVKACGVSGINNVFVGFRDVNGQRSVVSVPINASAPLYFTMPSGWTNGRAATVAAGAYDLATKKTEAWFALHPNTSSEALLDEWKRTLFAAMQAVGGSVSGTNHHGVFRTAPFVRSFVPKNCG